VNPINSFFAAPSRSNSPEANWSSSPRATSLSELEPGQHQYQTTEESEIASSSKTPFANDLEEMVDLLSNDIVNDEGSGSLKPCSLEEPTSSRNFLPADDDVQCTPVFGSIGRPVQPKSHFQLFESDERNTIQDGSIRSASRSENFESTLIQCSPVEHSISVPPLDPLEDVRHDHPEVGREKASRVMQLRLPISTETEVPLSTGTSPAKPSSASKLKDLWQRNVATQAPSGSKRRWEYKQEEIDEEVLAQLPAEIQMELRNSLKLNRPQQRPTKHPSISDFFPSSK